jgi:hypothetical protein
MLAPAVEEEDVEEEEEEEEGGGGVVLGGSAPGLTYRSSRSLKTSFTMSVVWRITPLCEEEEERREFVSVWPA